LAGEVQARNFAFEESRDVCGNAGLSRSRLDPHLSNDQTNMDQKISEFSYGFALTNEIVGWTTLKTTPIFPSLIEEGKKGGGYDVQLDMPGVMLYLQFKRAHCMTRRSAREIKNHKSTLSVPFYRFHITDSSYSDQHAMLLELDDGTSEVFYVAPRFHKYSEINDAWAAKSVANRSIFVRPTMIGDLDAGPHHVAYDATRAYLCSIPKPIEFMTAGSLVNRLSIQLSHEDTPLRLKLPELTSAMGHAFERGRQRVGAGST
jgi:hypothetical protein